MKRSVSTYRLADGIAFKSANGANAPVLTHLNNLLLTVNKTDYWKVVE